MRPIAAALLALVAGCETSEPSDVIRGPAELVVYVEDSAGCLPEWNGLLVTRLCEDVIETADALYAACGSLEIAVFADGTAEAVFTDENGTGCSFDGLEVVAVVR